ncbi:MAG: imidazolonepropionase [Bacteroidales bacterium]|nr:imidazolonepropionase [Bacteroidales bacterium]
MRLLVRNIKELVQVEEQPRERVLGTEMANVATVKDAYLMVEEGRIVAFGPMATLAEERADSVVDASGRLVMPCFCDSHTHLVYAGSREHEYCDKIRGLSYEEIAQRGGGILNSARRLQAASEEELYEGAMQRLEQMIRLGSGAVELKSGYGLTVEAEMKMLRVIRRMKETSPLALKATLLGAHGVPLEYRGRQGEFVDLVVREMIPQAAAEGLADYVDVFCDRGFFTPEEADRILEAGAKYGLRGKIHANELACSGGVQVAVRWNALSCDHLEHMGEAEIAALNGSGTMPTVLPGAAFFLGMPYAPARQMIDSGLGVAMASDCNPGSSPSGNMQLILSMACINYRLLPEEAINAVTLNSAYAMGVSHEVGSIAVGKQANFFITRPVPSLEYMPYSFGENKVEQVFIQGRRM